MIARAILLDSTFSGSVVVSSSAKFKTGHAVYGPMPPLQGTLAEYILAPVVQVAYKPQAVLYEQAAAVLMVGLTALQRLPPCAPFESTLVMGGSGETGHVALSVAKALGVERVVAGCSHRNADFCKSMGATHVVEYDSPNSSVEEQVTEFAPLDVIMDCVTSADPRDVQHNYPQRLLPYCQQRYIRLGRPSWDWFRASMERTLPLQCFGKNKLFWIRFPQSTNELLQLAEWADQGKLKPHVTSVMDFTAQQVQKHSMKSTGGECKARL